MSVDGLRRASVYYPSSSDAARVAIGTEVALPESTTLDDVLGDETIYGIFCPHPFVFEPLRRRLQASPDHPPQMDGCTVDVLHLHKGASASP